MSDIAVGAARAPRQRAPSIMLGCIGFVLGAATMYAFFLWTDRASRFELDEQVRIMLTVEPLYREEVGADGRHWLRVWTKHPVKYWRDVAYDQWQSEPPHRGVEFLRQCVPQSDTESLCEIYTLVPKRK